MLQVAATPIKRSFSAGKMAAFDNFDVGDYKHLPELGIMLGETAQDAQINLKKMHKWHRKYFAMDNLQAPITTASATVPVQFLQMWMPGYVHVLTEVRRIDDLIGMQVMGNWYDAEVVQGIAELQGLATPYNDYKVTNYAGDNENYIYQSIISFNIGMRVGAQEAARKARVNIDVAALKRNSAALQLEIQRNDIGFFGYNSGNNFTYGIFNAPGLSAYEDVPAGASTFTEWATKTAQEIISDILTAIQSLRTQSGGQIDPKRTNMILALPTSVVDYLSRMTDFGITARAWMDMNYPRIKIIDAPQFELVNGGENVGYLYADKVVDASTDGGSVWLQPCPTKLLVLGVAKFENYYVESYLNATAGAFIKRPIGVVRFTGI